MAKTPRRSNPATSSTEAKVLSLGHTLVAEVLKEQTIPHIEFTVPDLLMSNAALASAFAEAKESGFAADKFNRFYHDDDESCKTYGSSQGGFGGTVLTTAAGDAITIIDAEKFTNIVFALARGLQQEVRESRPSKRRTYVELAFVRLIAPIYNKICAVRPDLLGLGRSTEFFEGLSDAILRIAKYFIDTPPYVTCMDETWKAIKLFTLTDIDHDDFTPRTKHSYARPGFVKLTFKAFDGSTRQFLLHDFDDYDKLNAKEKANAYGNVWLQHESPESMLGRFNLDQVASLAFVDEMVRTTNAASSMTMETKQVYDLRPNKQIRRFYKIGKSSSSEMRLAQGNELMVTDPVTRNTDAASPITATLTEITGVGEADNPAIGTLTMLGVISVEAIEADVQLEASDRKYQHQLSLVGLPLVFGFDIKNGAYMVTHMGSIKPHVFQPSVIKNLHIPVTYKNFLRVLIAGQSGEIEGKDVVRGKGQGINILSSGSPGLGKTLAAEVLAENCEMPLYSIQCSQLGIMADAVENNLLELTQRAHRLGAVLLLDEADVYIRQRGMDIMQNAIVGAFLRVIEYSQGIIVMTTNMADSIDDAIESRCRVHFRFELPKIKSRRGILADHLTLHGYSEGTDYSEEALEATVGVLRGFSGRDIKFMVANMHTVLTSGVLPSKKFSSILDPELFKFCRAFLASSQVREGSTEYTEDQAQITEAGAEE